MFRSVPFVIAGLIDVLSAYAAPVAARTAAHPVRCASWQISYGGVETVCYGRQAFGEAAARLPFSPINPSAAVKRTTGLSLSSIAVESGPGPQAHKPLVTLELVYGRVPAKGLSLPPPRKPVYLFVYESHGVANHPDELNRAVGETGGRTYYGDWTYDGAIPSRHIVFSIDSNARRAVVLAAAHAIEQERR